MDSSGIWNLGLLAWVPGKVQSSWQVDSDFGMMDIVINDKTLSIAELNVDHLKLNIIKHNDLKNPRFIGGGTYSRVYAATWLGCTFAVKSLFYSHGREMQARELELNTTLCHPHIVQLVGVSFGPYQELMIVMELMDCSLRELIRNARNAGNNFAF